VLMKGPATGQLGQLYRLLRQQISFSPDSICKPRKKATRIAAVVRLRRL
jgi:hypothetical protein